MAMGWREPILRHFTSEIAAVAPLTVVLDPDRLLAEQRLLSELERQGFILIPFDDPVVGRFALESRCRAAWDAGEVTAPVIVTLATGDEATVPYDLLLSARRAGRVLRFSLPDLFPRLAPRVVAQLDRSDFDAVHSALADDPPSDLGETQTKDYLLRHVFGFAPEVIHRPGDLLPLLLRKHYRGNPLPETLDARLVELLAPAVAQENWPLATLIRDRDAYNEFVRQRFEAFSPRRQGTGQPVAGFAEPGTAGGSEDAALAALFEELFVAGFIAPDGAAAGRWPWSGLGLGERFQQLGAALKSAIPEHDADHLTWRAFALRWAEWLRLRWTLPEETVAQATEVEALHDEVETAFAEWLTGRYGALANLPPWPRPVMVHHIAHRIAHGWNPAIERDRRVALVVLDGLSLSQWTLIRPSLGGGRRVVEDTVFAWVPTLTAVSRQAIFAGAAPFTFAASLNTTDREGRHWARFWEDRGVAAKAVTLLVQRQGEPDATLIERVASTVGDGGNRVLGVVVSTVDVMIHGTPTGSAGLHDQVRHWANSGHFPTLVDYLLDGGYEVHITSDHGNVEATGIGKPATGALAEQRGERVQVFTDAGTRSGVQRQFPSAIAWPLIGLPDRCQALLAPGRSAFASQGARTIAHGGVSVEEVLVPYITITSV